MKRTMVFLLAAMAFAVAGTTAFAQASVTTDQPDYPPGSTVQISGSGFQPGETVQLQVVNLTNPSDIGTEHDPWQVTADASGNFQTTWFVTSDEAGATLQLTVTGLTSGLTAQTTFTDAAKTWVGGSSGHETDWNTAANWSPSGVPASGDDVTIPNGKTYYPILTNGQSFTIRSLTVDSGGQVTINSGGSLTASGADPLIAGIVNTAGTLDFGTRNLTSAGDTGTINISGGTVTCRDNNTTGMNFNMTGGTLSVHNLKGNITMSGSSLLQVTGTITPSTTDSFTGGTVNYTGNNANITGLTYFNLEISGGGTAVLQGTTTVNANLAIDSGSKLSLNGYSVSANTLTLGGVVQTPGTYNQSNASTYFTGTTTSVTVSAGQATKLAFSTAPATTTAGATMVNVVVQIQDASGNNIASNNVAITVSLNTGSFASGNTTTNTDTSGSATFNNLVINTAGSYTMTATASGLTSVTSGSFSINAAAASKLVFTTSAVTVTAGVASGTITVQRQDANGNPNTNGATITVNLTTSSSGGSFLSTNGVTTITSTNIVNGSSTASFLYKDTVAGSPTITNAASGLTSATQTETVNPGALNHFAVTTPGTPTAGTSFSITTITAQDANSNTVTSFIGTVDLTETGGGAGGTVTPSQSSAFTAGVLSGQSVTLSKSGSGVTITATDHAGTGKTGVSGTFTVNPGALHHFAIPAISSPQTAGTAITGITITAQDANNNTVSSFGSTVTFDGTAGVTGTSASFSSGVLSGASVTPTVAGSSLTVTVTDGASHTGSATITTINPAAIDHYSVTFSGTPFKQGIPFTTLVTAKDVYNNTVTTDSTTVVTNTSTSLNMMWEDPATPGVYNNGTTPAEAAHARRTLINGVATFNTIDLVVELGVTTTATDANGKTGTSDPINIRTEAGSYRSKTSGNWGDTGTWEYYDSSSNWVAAVATPSYTDGLIVIQSGHTVTVAADVTVDQVYVQSGGQINVNSGTTLTVTNISIPGMGIYGTVNVAGTLDTSSGITIVYGVVSGGGVLENSGTINSSYTTFHFEALNVAGSILGGKYRHLFTTTPGTIPTAQWETNTLCEIAGYTSNTTTPGGLNQSFHDFIWNCPSQTGTIALDGNFTAVVGDFTVTSTGSGAITLGGDLAVTGTATVSSGATLNCGTHAVTGAAFILDAGGTLGIGSADGITSSGASGNIQTTTRNFATGGNYIYNGTAAQATGNGLPTTINSLTINNAGGTVTLGQVTTIATSVMLAGGAKLDLPSGTSSAATLSLGGVSKSSGTWGSTSSSASHQNDTFFAGTGVLNITSGQPSAFSGLTASQAITYGTTSITLNGKVSATGPLYPASGATITVTINGNAQTTTINDATGDFSLNYNPSTIPFSASAYTITYAYAGDDNLNSAADTSTALTVNKASTSVSVSSSENPAAFKDSVIFTATLPSDATGSVIFKTNSVLFDTETLSGGSTTTTNSTLPRGTQTITAEYAGDGNYTGSTNDLAGGQVVTNHPPVANAATYNRAKGTSIKINVTNLLAQFTSDADGDAVRLASFGSSTNGSTLTLTTNGTTSVVYIVLTPANNLPESFSYTVSDSNGGTNGALITVNVTNAVGQVTGSISTTGGGAVTTTWAGIPGSSYVVQRSPDLSTWTDLWTTNAPTAGVFIFTDPAPPQPTAYYRLRQN